MNLTRQKLITQQISEPKAVIDISNLFSRVYFVRLANDMKIEAGRIAKQ
jgi:hypothetical protein